MIQESLINFITPWIQYISAFIIIILGTILNGLVSVKSRDEKWLVKVQQKPSPIFLFIIIEAIVIYVGSIVLQPYLNIWLIQNILFVPTLLLELIMLFYIWFQLAFGSTTNKLLLIVSQIVAIGMIILFYTNIAYTIYFTIGTCVVFIVYYLFF